MDVRRRKTLLILSVIIPLICYMFFSFTGQMYAYSDNLMVAAVTAGLYGDNNFCQYLHPLFCIIIKHLNLLFPFSDVFTSIVHMSLFCSAVLLIYVGNKPFLNKEKKQWQIEDYFQIAIVLISVIYYLIGLNVFGENYTVQTAAIIFAGVVCLFSTTSNNRWSIVTSTILVVIGFLIRIEASLIYIPFICLHLVCSIFDSSDRKTQLRRHLKTYLPCLIIIIILFASKYVWNSVEPYVSDAEYNKYRTITEDYWMKGWDGYDPAFEEIDKSTYYAAIDWILIDTDRINTEMLKKITNAGNILSYEVSLRGVGYALQAMYRRVRYSNLQLLLLTVLTLSMMIRNLFCLKSFWFKLESIFSVIGGFIILIYFTFIGRAPLRVWIPVLLASLSLLIVTMSIDIRDSKKGRDVVFLLFLCLIMYFGIGQVFTHAQFHPLQTAFTARFDADDSSYEITFENNSLYIWPHWYDQIPEYFSKRNKLPTKRVMEHNIAMGDWTYGQTYYTNFLKTINADNPALSLLERPNTFFVEGLNEEFLEYMQEHYGKNIQMEYVHDVNGKKAYKLVQIEQKEAT